MWKAEAEAEEGKGKGAEGGSHLGRGCTVVECALEYNIFMFVGSGDKVRGFEMRDERKCLVSGG